MKYSVDIHEEITYSISVYADSVEEAEEKAKKEALATDWNDLDIIDNEFRYSYAKEIR